MTDNVISLEPPDLARPVTPNDLLTLPRALQGYIDVKADHLNSRIAGLEARMGRMESLVIGMRGQLKTFLELPVKPASRKNGRSIYAPLHNYFMRVRQDSITLSFKRVETLIDRELPPGARRASWWTNRTSQSRAKHGWLPANRQRVTVDVCGTIVRVDRMRDSALWRAP